MPRAPHWLLSWLDFAPLSGNTERSRLLAGPRAVVWVGSPELGQDAVRLGVPQVAVALTEAQEQLAEALARTGTADTLAVADLTAAGALSRAVQDVLNDQR